MAFDFKGLATTSGSSLECSTRRCLWLFPLQIEKSDAEIIAMERKAAEIAEATVAKAKRLQYQKTFQRKPKRQ
jgi:hypothetical protein